MASVAPLPHRCTVEEYHRMASAGLFDEDDRVELLGGEIIDMAPIGSRHAAAVDRLTRLLVTRLGEGGSSGCRARSGWTTCRSRNPT